MALKINDTASFRQYTATAGQTSFAVPFEFFENANLRVYKNDTLLTLTTHYTVSGAGADGGGTVTLVSGATTGDTITILRDVAVQRVTDFPTSGPFEIESLNTELSRLTAMVQQLETVVDERALILADFDTPASVNRLPSADERSSGFFYWDANGQPTIANLTLTTADSGTLFASVAALASVASPVSGQVAVLVQAGREGTFVFSTANLSTMVTADPGQGVYVPPAAAPTGASGAWVRVDKVLRPEMFGAAGTGASDDTTALRRCCAMACTLDRPVRAAGTYKISDGIVVGSLTGSAPAAGTADNFTFTGEPFAKFVIASTVTTNEGGYFYVFDSDDVRIENVYFDIQTAATNGYGQVRLVNCNRFIVRNVSKIRTSANFGSNGSSSVSLTGCTDGLVEKVICRNAGPTSAGVFMVNVGKTVLRDVECNGGQEGIDQSGCYDITVDGVRGYNVNSVLETANTVRGNYRNIYGHTVTYGMILKTEAASGTIDLGANDNVFEDIHIEEFTDLGIGFQAGATATQTLHRNIFRNVRLSTTVGTSASRGIRPVRGDNTSDPMTGNVVENASVKMNLGHAIELTEMVNYRFSNLLLDAPTAVSNAAPSSFVTNTNGIWENVTCPQGNFTSIHRRMTLTNFSMTGGTLYVLDALGTVMSDLKFYNTTTDSLHIQFSNSSATADKATRVSGVRIINNSVGGAGFYGIKLNTPGSAMAAQNIHISDVIIRDNQGTATSGGIFIDNLTTDYCSLSGVRTVALATNRNYGFYGLGSVNRDNRFSGLAVGQISGSVALDGAFTYLGYNAVQQVSSSGTITIPNDSSSVYPIGYEIEWEAKGALPTFAAAGGVTINSRGGLLTTTAGGVVKLRKTAANNWSLSGDLA